MMGFRFQVQGFRFKVQGSRLKGTDLSGKFKGQAQITVLSSGIKDYSQQVIDCFVDRILFRHFELWVGCSQRPPLAPPKEGNGFYKQINLLILRYFSNIK